MPECSDLKQDFATLTTAFSDLCREHTAVKTSVAALTAQLTELQIKAKEQVVENQRLHDAICSLQALLLASRLNEQPLRLRS